VIAFADEPNVWLQVGRIVLLDLLLAGDNALVIALAVRTLPRREQRLGRLWGTLGAVVLRVLCLAVAAWMLQVPLLRLCGGLVLIWIAFKLLAPKPHGELPDAGGDDQGGAAPVRAGRNLGDAIKVIVVADISMSIDNVLAVTGAAEGHLGLAVLGVALSIPLVIWGSAILSRIMENHQWIVWLGGGVLGQVAGVLILEDPKVAEWLGAVAQPNWHWLPLGLAGALTVFGWWGTRRSRRSAG
jgi:YjbE family integral membrane protein